MLARLSGCFYDVQYRLSLAFEVKSFAPIDELGIVGNVVMLAVIASLWLIAWDCFHEQVI